METLRRYCFDRAFIGMNGIDLKYGFTTPDEQEALIKETAMKLSNDKYILVDQTKFNQVQEYLSQKGLKSLHLRRHLKIK